jgi:integrase
MAAWRERTNLEDAERSNNIILNPAQVNAVVQESFARYGEHFGTYVWVHAETGARSSQIEALDVEDLCDATTDTPTLVMPRSKKGKIIKTEPIRVRISVPLARQLLTLCGDRRDGNEPLLVDEKGARITPVRHFCYERTGAKRNRISEIAKELKLPKARETGKLATLYALRHSSIVHMLLMNKPIRVVAAIHDTSVAMIERTYGKHITDPAVHQMGDAIIPIEREGGGRAKVIRLKRK